MPDRIETGVVQFEDDWPGIFIRGDNALGYALALQGVLEVCESGKIPHPWHLRKLKSLARMLRSCDARKSPNAQIIHQPSSPAQEETK